MHKEKTYITYNNCRYQISTVYLSYFELYETMIFPVINGIVSGNEVFTFRTFNKKDSIKKHIDICQHPEKYLSKEKIQEYKIKGELQ